MRAAFALLLLTACREPTPIVALVPDLPDSATHLAVLLLSADGEVSASTGLFARAEIQRQAPLEETAEVNEVLVVAYEADQLDPSRLPSAEALRDGRLRFAVETEAVLPTPAYVARGTPGDEVPLTRTTLDRPLTASWVTPCSRTACGRLPLGPLRELRVPGELLEPSRVSLRLPDGSAALFFHGESNTPVYRFTPPDRIEVLTASVAGPRLRGARSLTDGRVALLQEDGHVWIGSASGDFERHEGSQAQLSARALAVSRVGDPMEIYVIDTFADVHVLTATAWRRVHEGGLPTGESHELEWLAPGELVYVAPEADRLWHFDRDGLVRTESVIEIRTLVYVPGWGPTLSAGAAQQPLEPSLLVWEDDGLRVLNSGIARRAPLAIWPTGGAREIYFGGTNGEVTYFIEGLGRCDLERYTSGGLRGVVPLEAGLLILPGRKDDNDYPGETKILFVPFQSAPLVACEDAYRPTPNAD